MKTFNQKQELSEDNLLTSTNRRLKSSREQLAITQEEVASDLGLSVAQIQKYEAGDQSIIEKLFNIIAKCFCSK